MVVMPFFQPIFLAFCIYFSVCQGFFKLVRVFFNLFLLQLLFMREKCVDHNSVNIASLKICDKL